MQKNHLILAFPCKDTARIKQMFPGSESVPWLYLGQDFFKRRYIELDMGNRFKRIDITRLHEEVARDIRREHIEWVDDLNRRHGKSIEWWFGILSSRNPYNNNIFQYCCYLEILKRLWEQGTKPELVFFESTGLAGAFQKWAKKKNIIVKTVHYNHAKLETVRSQLLFFLRWGNFFVTLSLRRVAAYVTRKKHDPEKLKADKSLILDTYLHDYSLSDDGIFKDRYFPYLHEYLSEKGIPVLVHPVLFGFRYNYFSVYRKMRMSRTNFIIQEDYLHFSDYLSALIYPVKFLSQKIRDIPFRDFDLCDIIREERKLQSVVPGMEAILIYHLFLRLGKSGLRPKLIIDWYENQVIDRALIAGARRAFPEAKIVGAQMFIHSESFSRLFPSESEVDANIAPHILLETSQYLCSIARSFSKNIPCKPAAALRYSHVFSDDMDRCMDFDQKPVILVLLSFSIAEAVELLETLKEGLEQIRDGVPILIKGHPDYDSIELVHAFGKQNWPTRFEIFEGNLPDALKQASVVISSNSGSMVEAAAKGTPVIFFGRQTVLNQNTLSNLNMEIVTECFSTSELVTAIEKYLNLIPTEKTKYKEMGKKIRDLFFEPVNEKTLLPFLGIEKDDKW